MLSRLGGPIHNRCAEIGATAREPQAACLAIPLRLYYAESSPLLRCNTRVYHTSPRRFGAANFTFLATKIRVRSPHVKVEEAQFDLRRVTKSSRVSDWGPFSTAERNSRVIGKRVNGAAPHRSCAKALNSSAGEARGRSKQKCIGYARCFAYVTF